MARIGHRCGCGHTDMEHITDENGKRRCNATYPCARSCTELSKPELLPTFDVHGQPVERIIPPGEGLGVEPGPTVGRTCTCNDCAALYFQLTEEGTAA